MTLLYHIHTSLTYHKQQAARPDSLCVCVCVWHAVHCFRLIRHYGSQLAPKTAAAVAPPPAPATAAYLLACLQHLGNSLAPGAL